MHLKMDAETVMDDMIAAKTYWVWAVDFPGIKAGEPVSPAFKKRIFRHWVENGWVREAE